MQEEEESSPEARRWLLCRSLGDGACRSDGCSSATKIPRYEYLCLDTSQTAHWLLICTSFTLPITQLLRLVSVVAFFPPQSVSSLNP